MQSVDCYVVIPKTFRLHACEDLTVWEIFKYILNNISDCNRRGNMIVDHFLMVYDLRMVRAIAPIQVAIDPIFLKIVPTYSDRICVVSQVP